MIVRASALLLALAAHGCIASNVVAEQDRMVAAEAGPLAWQPATELALSGYYESVDVRGEVAASLRRVYYHFRPSDEDPDGENTGRYAGAALIANGDALEFQTLNGRWHNGPDGLVLDDNAPVVLEQAADHLRITAPNGVLVLRRQEIE